ncbi:MAG: hypothetical protein E4H28_00685 [Gemmatimonadales bacterium]|nr:MAG: hypothetical protein E4H28_00685 [Gemmatimonadales bacterium]
MKSDTILDFAGTYEQYVHSCGDDHLDVDTVVLKAQDKKSKARKVQKAAKASGDADQSVKELKKRREEITSGIEAREARLGELDATFSDPAFYNGTSPEEMRALQAERQAVEAEVSDLVAAWEEVEEELGELA